MFLLIEERGHLDREKEPTIHVTKYRVRVKRASQAAEANNDFKIQNTNPVRSRNESCVVAGICKRSIFPLSRSSFA